jgi:hypothetical protein
MIIVGTTVVISIRCRPRWCPPACGHGGLCDTPLAVRRGQEAIILIQHTVQDAITPTTAMTTA